MIDSENQPVAFKKDEGQPNTIRAFLDARQPSPPESLYHYTSAQGLQGRLESGEMWATSIHYLNDVSEYIHALRLAHAQLRELEKTAEPIVREAISEMFLQLEGLRDKDLFVASFSEEMDLLSQWRAYCPAKGGFSIGLSQETILAGDRPDTDLNLRKCVYDPKEQQQLVRDAIEWSIGPLPEAQKAAGWWPHNVGVWFHRLMALTAPILKDPNFHEEKEWRLILLRHDTTPDVLFRAGEAMLIPYVKSPLYNDTVGLKVQRVVVGPTAELGLSFESMRRYLGWLGLDCQVRTTSVPYRNW